MKYSISIVLLATCLLGASIPSYAKAASATQAFNSFERAAGGDESAVTIAIEQFEELLKQQPSHPMYEARIGSLITMQARDAWAPWKKMSYSEQGLERIDLALDSLTEMHDQQRIEKYIVSLDVRYTAAVTFSSLPKFFNRWGEAERLLQQLVQDALLEQAPASFKAQVWMTRAQLARQREELPLYKEYLHKVVSVSADSPQGIQAEHLLAEVSRDE